MDFVVWCSQNINAMNASCHSDKKDLVIRLLKQCLALHRLTAGLEAVGLSSEESYDFEIVDIVFDLMGYDRKENLDWFLNAYTDYVTILDHQTLGDQRFVTLYANQLYENLCQKEKVRSLENA